MSKRVYELDHNYCKRRKNTDEVQEEYELVSEVPQHSSGKESYELDHNFCKRVKFTEEVCPQEEYDLVSGTCSQESLEVRPEVYPTEEPEFTKSMETDEDINDDFYERNGLIERPEGKPEPSVQPVIAASSKAPVQSGGQDEFPTPFPQFEFDILSESAPRESTKFERIEYSKTIGLKHNIGVLKGKVNLYEVEETIHDFYANVVTNYFAKESHNPADMYSVAIKNWYSGPDPDFKHYNIFIAPKPILEFNRKEFLENLNRVSQSNEKLFLSGLFDISVYVTRTLSGGGWTKCNKSPKDIRETSKRRKCVINIDNKDSACGYRAIYVGLYFHCRVEGKDLELDVNRELRLEWLKIRQPNHYKSTLQEEGARQMCRDIGLNFNKELRVDDLHKIQEWMDKTYENPFQLVVVSGQNGDKVLYYGDRQWKDKLVLEFITDNKGNGHYNFVKSLDTYYKYANYCRYCFVKHRTIDHKCHNRCKACNSLSLGECKLIELVHCDICNRSFNNAECYENHKANLFCDNFLKEDNIITCSSCDVQYKNNPKAKKHECNVFFCTKCNKRYEEQPHYCIMSVPNEKRLKTEDSKNKIIVSYDIESMQSYNKALKGNQHAPILLIAEVTCDDCWDYNENKRQSVICDTCGVGNLEFYGNDCVEQFTKVLYEDLAPRAEKLKNRVHVFAHNARGYDGHFIMQDMFDKQMADVEVMMSGLKVLKLDVGNVRYLDSLSFFQQALSQLPKSFGFEKEVEKGFFPHLFNTFENQNYIGAIPKLKYFGTAYMTPKAAQECSEWHKSFTGTYHFKEEIKKYCRNDVKILMMAIMAFRNLFIKETELDPISRNVTLPSAALEYFRTHCLNENEIGITPLNGYIKTRKTSMASNVWLDRQQKLLGKKIKREIKIGPLYADGYIPEDNHAFEFLGCYWHGCEKCNENNRFEKQENLNNKSLFDVHYETEQKIDYYKRKGIQLTHIWECEYKKLREANEDENTYFNERIKHYSSIKKYGHISIRDSFFGGRTNNLKFNVECNPHQKIRYLDVCSLYPYVLSNRAYPIGHPIVITEDFNYDISEYRGFIKCRVLPPQNLYIPVLPMRANKKLVFPLCRSCGELGLNGPENCTHSVEEREMYGTWCTQELQLAVSHGYKITKIYEVLHYEQASDQIFKDYNKKWLRLKTEATGFPRHMTTEDEKREFIEEFERREGVELNYDNMTPNSGLRFIAKLMLNSLWGKLGQRPNQGMTKICHSYADYLRIVRDPKLEIRGEVMPNTETLIVSYKYIEDDLDRPGNTNIAIASMVTANARIKLFTELFKVESASPGRVIYKDTDSMFFTCDDKHSEWYVPEVNNFLGDWTDEVAKDYGPEAYIYKFASCGPKNYSYVVKVPGEEDKICIKAKGITINNKVSKSLTFNRVWRYAESYYSDHTVKKFKYMPQLNFRSTKTHDVFTTEGKKMYRAVSEKRKIVKEEDNYQTVPFGYKSIN